MIYTQKNNTIFRLWKKIVLASCLVILTMLNPFEASAQWVMLNAGTIADLNEIVFTSRDTGYIVGSRGTLLKTNNGGQTWNALSNGHLLDLHDVFFLNSEEGWVVGDSGLISHTLDGGASWINAFLPNAASINLHAITAVNADIIFVGGSNWLTAVYLFKSVDGGHTFQASHVDSFLWAIDITKIGMVTQSVGYALTRGMVLKTIDGGLQWKIADTGSVFSFAMYSVLEDFSLFPNSDTMFVCGWYPAYFGKSTDAAAHFAHDYEHDYTCLDFINRSTGYVGGWKWLRKTVNGGQNFVDASGGDSSYFAAVQGLDFWDEQTGYACGKKGLIVKTTNGGGTSVGHDGLATQPIEVFPNPTDGLLRFTTKLHATLTDLQGRAILVQEETNILDLSTLAAGIYVLSLVGENGELVRRTKIIKR
jgi:photosystem II stability/assembly factor-like uncharacterized protein